MATLDTEELHAALFGTWTAVARIAELLIRRAVLSEDELGSLLTTAEMTTTDRQSRVGMAIVRGIMESAVRHGMPVRNAPPRSEAVNQGVEKTTKARAAFGADRRMEMATDSPGKDPGERQATADAMVKGSDFDDATLPGRRLVFVAEGGGQRDSGAAARSTPAPGPASPRRITDRVVELEGASLLNAAV
jgi:hypothetical protein